MSVEKVDRDPNHLFPAFRTKLAQCLTEISVETGDEWIITEGYRSQERQLWLYGQGRTRPGQIVTWMRTPKHHGAGLAADVLPKRRGYNAPRNWWEKLRRIYFGVGLENPAWGNGDLGHIQWPAADKATHTQATAWVRAGFPGKSVITAVSSEVPVYINGMLVPDADAYRDRDRIFAALRPVTDALDWVIAEVAAGRANVVNDQQEIWVPLTLRAGRGFTALRDLEPLARQVAWDNQRKRVVITG